MTSAPNVAGVAGGETCARDPYDARVDSEIALTEASLSAAQIEAFCTAFQLPNAKHEAAQRAGRSTAYIPRFVSALRRVDGELRIPRGAHAVVTKILRSVRWDDRRCVGEAHQVELQLPMREHQYGLAEALMLRGQGIAHNATGGGKTGAGAAAKRITGTSALWIAPTIDLVEQARVELRRFLAIEPTICVAGRFERAPMVITTWDTARKHLPELRGYFGLLVVDECHGALAPTRLEVVRACDARYRLGLTATLKQEDLRSPLLAWHFGRVLSTYTVEDGVQRGVLARPTWRALTSEFRFAWSSADDWPALQEALFTDAPRAKLIADDVARDAAGRLALVLSARIAPLNMYRDLLVAGGVRAEVLTGEMSRTNRAATLARARAGEVSVLLSTSLADEGLDLVTADRLYMTAPTKSPTRLLQRVGRVVRVHEGKRQPEIVDVVDQHVGLLARQARLRRETFDATWGDS